MTTEELIKAAKELVELDGKRTPGKWEPQLAEAVRMYRKLGHTTVGPKTTQDGEFCVHAANNSAKIARALIVAVEEIEALQDGNVLGYTKNPYRLDSIAAGDTIVAMQERAKEALAEIQKIAEG